MVDLSGPGMITVLAAGAISFLSVGPWPYLTWWLDRGAKLPADRIEAMFRRLALDGMASSFSLQPQVNAVEGKRRLAD